MKNKLFIFFTLLSLGSLLFSSCKSTRSVMKKPIKEYGFDYLYNKMLENQVSFDYLSAKFNVVYYNGKKKTDLKGQFRIRKDSLIWITLSPALGIEAARISMSHDSIKFLNRLNKTYFKGKYSFLDSILNTTLDYYILESMLLGNELTQYDISKFKASIDGGLYRITIQERRKIKKYLKSGEVDSKVLVQNIWLDPETFKIRRVVLKELGDDNKRLQIVYAQYHEVDSLLLPEIMQIKISAGTTILVNLKFGKTVINQPLRFPFTISSKYQKLEAGTQ